MMIPRVFEPLALVGHFLRHKSNTSRKDEWHDRGDRQFDFWDMREAGIFDHLLSLDVGELSSAISLKKYLFICFETSARIAPLGSFYITILTQKSKSDSWTRFPPNLRPRTTQTAEFLGMTLINSSPDNISVRSFDKNTKSIMVSELPPIGTSEYLLHSG